MSIALLLRVLMVGATGVACGFCWSADKLCPVGVAPLANLGGPLAPVPLVNLHGGALAPSSLQDPAGALLRSLVLSRAAEPLKQVPIDIALKEAHKADPNLKFSPAELVRLGNSGACKAAYTKLLLTFSKQHKTFNELSELPVESALQRFVAWWFHKSTTADQKAAAQPVLDAQREFDSACLSKEIPDEMGPDAIEATVGVLVFDDLPFCAAFRKAKSELMTARHCFIDAEGNLRDAIQTLAESGKRLWFQYPAEPGHRFEVCKSTIPLKGDGFKLHPERDRITLAVAPTAATVPKWEWADAKPGASLYVRGYFAFGTEAKLLERMRGSSSGGCAALAVKGKCVLNGCQSLPTSSGAPVFLRSEPGGPPAPLRVVGLHLGSSDYADTALPESCPALKPSDLPSGNVAFQFREN